MEIKLMNFSFNMLPVKRQSVFQLKDFEVWCGTMVEDGRGGYVLFFSFWPKNKGFNAWVTHSKIGYATAKTPLGPWRFGGIALSGAGGGAWDRDVVHNPSALLYQGRYYLYYTGNYGNGEYWDQG